MKTTQTECKRHDLKSGGGTISPRCGTQQSARNPGRWFRDVPQLIWDLTPFEMEKDFYSFCSTRIGDMWFGKHLATFILALFFSLEFGSSLFYVGSMQTKMDNGKLLIAMLRLIGTLRRLRKGPFFGGKRVVYLLCSSLHCRRLFYLP